MKSLLIILIMIISGALSASEMVTRLVAQCQLEDLELTVFSGDQGQLYLSTNGIDYSITHQQQLDSIIFGNSNIILRIFTQHKETAGNVDADLYFKINDSVIFVDDLSCYYYGMSTPLAALGSPDEPASMGGGVTVGNGPTQNTTVDPIEWNLKKLPFDIGRQIEIIDVPSIEIISLFPQWK